MNIEYIKEQFKNVITYSQGIPNPQIDSLFERWYKAKERFIEMFDGELIYEVPVELEFELDEKSQNIKFYDFLENIERTYENYDLANFLLENKEGFYSNEVVSTSDPKMIPLGMKLIKSMKYFEGHEKTLRKIQDEASCAIQQNRVSGKLCFSVHPLDFLSSSENVNKWHSCHTLDGGYRAGNLSYMIDECSIICYLKSKEEVNLPNFPKDIKWNNKKWRVMIMISPDDKMIVASRQYPYASQKALNQTLSELDKMINSHTSCQYEWDNTYIANYIDKNGMNKNLINSYIPYRGELYKAKDFIESSYNSCHYDDIYDSPFYTTPNYSFRKYYGVYNYILPKKINVGSAVECLECGQAHITPGDGTMRCVECELKYGTEINDIYGICDCCGRRMFVEDSYNIDGNHSDTVCENCFQDYCFVCPNCDGIYYNEDKYWDSENGVYLCGRCKEDIE